MIDWKQEKRSRAVTQIAGLKIQHPVSRWNARDVGDAGEKVAMFFFDAHRIPWIRLDQTPLNFCDAIPRAEGKRPDFLVSLDGEPFFVEVKHVGMYKWSDKSRTAYIDKDDLPQADRNAQLFGCVTLYLLVDRNTDANRKDVRFVGIADRSMFTERHPHKQSMIGARFHEEAIGTVSVAANAA